MNERTENQIAHRFVVLYPPWEAPFIQDLGAGDGERVHVNLRCKLTLAQQDLWSLPSEGPTRTYTQVRVSY